MAVKKAQEKKMDVAEMRLLRLNTKAEVEEQHQEQDFCAKSVGQIYVQLYIEPT